MATRTIYIPDDQEELLDRLKAILDERGQSLSAWFLASVRAAVGDAPAPISVTQRIAALELEVENKLGNLEAANNACKRRDVRIGELEAVLGTLISWMAQSANSPISQIEATTLLDKLQEKRDG